MIDFSNILKEKLYNILEGMGVREDFNILVYDERIFNDEDFQRKLVLKPNTLYIAIKYLKGEIFVDSTELPIIIMAYSEENSFEIARNLFDIFTRAYNLKILHNVLYNEVTEDGENEISERDVKLAFGTPVVSETFVDIGNGTRALLSVGGNLSIFIDSNDIKKIDLVTKDENGNTIKTDVEFYRGSINYSLIPDTQPSLFTKFNSTEGKFTNVALALTLPFKKPLVRNDSDIQFRFLKCLSYETDISEIVDEWDKFVDDGTFDYSNEWFRMRIELASGDVLYWKLKLLSLNLSFDKGGLPSLNATLGV